MWGVAPWRTRLGGVGGEGALASTAAAGSITGGPAGPQHAWAMGERDKLHQQFALN